MTKSVIVIVPGCWHVPAHFDYVTAELKTAGYVCIGVELPGNTRKPMRDGRLTGIDDDVAAVRQTVMHQLEAGNDVVVVTHSYSSIPGTAALANLDLVSRKSAGQSNGVVGVVIISGFLLPIGTTMLTVMGGHLPPQYFHDNDVTLPFGGPGAIHVLYNDLERNEALKAVWKLEPQSYGINTSPIPDQLAGLKNTQLSYLMCNNDNAVPFEAQKMTIEGFRSAGVKVRVEVAPSGHSPFLKLPAETARFIKNAAGEEIHGGFEQYVEGR